MTKTKPRFLPHVTVAAIIEQEGRFLMVEEIIDGTTRYNQPAGHLEARESLMQAVVREVLEETAYHFVPDRLVGMYHFEKSESVTFLRFTFAGKLTGFDATRDLDPDIVATHFWTFEEIVQRQAAFRSPLVRACLEDYRQGRAYPLSLLTNITR